MLMQRQWTSLLNALLTWVWIVVLFVEMTSLLLPRTTFSAPVDKLRTTLLGWLGWYERAAGLTLEGACWSYFMGYVFLLCLLVGYTYLRSLNLIKPVPVAHFADAVSIFALLYLLNFFIATGEIFPFRGSLWIYMLSFFFLILFFVSDKKVLVMLIKLLVVIIGIQCLYAIVYYMLDINQFYTPHFGRRSGGTVGLADLYPLCLVGLPLSLSLTTLEPRWRWFWWIIGVDILLALTFTYTRSGWIAFAISATYLALSSRSPLRSQRWEPWLLIALAVAVFLGTAFVRTGGKLMGNPDDRSFWGRFAIWQTAIRVILDHPILGSGLNTYPQKQREHMTNWLAHFNPMNVEAKNLYLTLAAELGLIGLGLFFWVAWRYWQLYRFVLQTFPLSSEVYKIAVGLHAALIGIAVAGLADTPILHRTRPAATFVVVCLLGTLCSLVHQTFPDPVPDEATLKEHQRRFWRWVGFIAASLSIPFAYLSWNITKGVREALSMFPKVHEVAGRSPRLPSFVRLKDIPSFVRDAVIASEDGHFYFHHGVDWLALHRALRNNIRSLRIRQGGSTITMQVARYLFLSRERTLPRKVAEILLALEMEKVLPKDRILELYLNTARFGMGEDGIFAAAQNYFGKNPKALTLAEAAFLAGVLPEPPFERSQITPEFVRRCQRRTFERLQMLFPTQYPLTVIREAQRQPLRFAWGAVINPSGENERWGAKRWDSL